MLPGGKHGAGFGVLLRDVGPGEAQSPVTLSGGAPVAAEGRVCAPTEFGGMEHMAEGEVGQGWSW